MNASYEFIEHTADIGVRARGADLPEAFAHAALGMLALIVSPETVRPSVEETVEVEGTDGIDLLVEWLRETLFRCDAHRRVFSEVVIEEFSPWRLRARLRGEAIDPGRHDLKMEIKAVTYHGARLYQDGDAWVAEVLFDI